MNTELSIYEKISDPITAVTQLGEMFARSGMFGCQKLEQGQVLALACITERRSPFELVKTYHIIEGKLEMKASAMLARFLEMGGKCIWKSNLQSEEAQAYFEFGDNKGEFSYSMEDAKREGLKDKNVWKKSAPDMLRARLVSKVIRMFAPQINAGLYCEEESMGDEVLARELNLGKVEVEVGKPETQPEPKPAKGKVVESEPTPEATPEAVDPAGVDFAAVQEAVAVEAEANPFGEEPPHLPMLERTKVFIQGIGEERVLHFLRTRGKLKEGEGIDALSESYLNNIVTMPDVFEKAIIAAEKKEKGDN